VGAAPQDHLALAPEVAGGASGRPFDRRDLSAQGLSSRNQFHEPSVEFRQLGPQFFQIHVQKYP
jgi:hypothetical protein